MIRFFTPLLVAATLPLLAESPLKKGAKLNLISNEFELADGPSWDGWSLTIPDPLAEQTKRLIASKSEWQNQFKGERFSASFFNHGHHYFSDNGNGAILKRDYLTKELEVIHRENLEADRSRKPNDLVVDRSGGVYFTLTRAGQIIYISPEGESSVAAEGVETANGIILNPDESILYASEAAPKRIVAFNVGTGGRLTSRRLFASMEGEPLESRAADGMTIDRAGNVYCAGPTDIWVWSPDGQLIEKIACPERPVNLTFGGADLRDLYISGFGGVYHQRMRISGVSPQPPAAWSEQEAKTKPSVTLPKGVTPHLDLTYAQYGPRKMLADIYIPQGDGPFPAAAILHGGGWHSGDKMKFRAMAIELAKRGYVTMAIAYRLSEEARFPANIQDCHAAIRYLRANAEKFSADPNRIGVLGGSAGAHLAGLLAATADVKKLHGEGGHPGVSSAVQAAVVMSGPMEIATGNVAERSLLIDNPKPNAIWLFGGNVEEKSELYALADAHQHIDENTPPILFQYGGTEDPSRTLPSMDKLMELGIRTKVLSDYPEGKHGCWNRHPWFLPMVEDIDQWFQEHL